MRRAVIEEARTVSDVTIGIVWQSTPEEVGRGALAGYVACRYLGKVMPIELAGVFILSKGGNGDERLASRKEMR